MKTGYLYNTYIQRHLLINMVVFSYIGCILANLTIYLVEEATLMGW